MKKKIIYHFKINQNDSYMKNQAVVDICAKVTPLLKTGFDFAGRCRQHRLDTVTGLRVFVSSLHPQNCGVTFVTTVIFSVLCVICLHLKKSFKELLTKTKKHYCVRYWTLKRKLHLFTSQVRHVLAVYIFKKISTRKYYGNSISKSTSTIL